MINEKNNPIRVGVVGLGKMGLLHASILNVIPDVKLVAVCDKSSLIRRISSRLLKGVKCTEDIQDFTGLDIDAIFVTTPIPSHFFLIKKIYEEKLAPNLFAEKTLASDFAKSKELAELANASGGVAMVGYMKRYSVTFNKARSILNQKILGDLASFEAYAYSSDFAETDEESTISGHRGGVLGDLGSHVVDLALWFFGGFEVESAKLKLTSNLSEDSAQFNVKGASSLKGSFDISWCKPGYRMPEFGLTLKGKNGTLTVNDDEVTLTLDSKKPQKWYRLDLDDNVDFLLGAPEYYREDEHFIKSIINKEKIESDFYSASQVDYILDQVKAKADKQ